MSNGGNTPVKFCVEKMRRFFALQNHHFQTRCRNRDGEGKAVQPAANNQDIRINMLLCHSLHHQMNSSRSVLPQSGYSPNLMS